jgi:hypothetical protein
MDSVGIGYAVFELSNGLATVTFGFPNLSRFRERYQRPGSAKQVWRVKTTTPHNSSAL